MSGTTGDTTARPWHGTDNPYEAIYQDYTAQLAALRAEVGTAKAVPDVSDRVATLEAEVAALKTEKAANPQVAADLRGMAAAEAKVAADFPEKAYGSATVS